MHGYLTKIIERRLRRLTLGAVFGLGVGTIGVVTTEQVDHPGLAGADLAVARAQILLTDVCGASVEVPSEACEKRLEKALALLARIRATITDAAMTAAGP